MTCMWVNMKPTKAKKIIEFLKCSGYDLETITINEDGTIKMLRSWITTYSFLKNPQNKEKENI